jgi:hypothetical protein
MVPPSNLLPSVVVTLPNYVIEVSAINTKTFEALLEEIEALPTESEEPGRSRLTLLRSRG